MRGTILIAAAALVVAASVERAEARRGGAVWVDSQELHFVAPTKVSNGSGGLMALCHLSTRSHLLGLGFFRQMEGYALSHDNCTGTSYIPVTAARIERMFSGGELPAGLPAEPRMQLAQVVSGFAGTAAIGATAVLFGLLKLGKALRRRRRRGAMHGANGFGQRVLDVMCHAAKADGVVDAEEVQLIAFASEKLTGSAYSNDQIGALVNMAGTKLSDDEFRAFGEGLSASQRGTLMRGALMVTISDGTITQSEKGFLARLAATLGISASEMQLMLRSL